MVRSPGHSRGSGSDVFILLRVESVEGCVPKDAREAATESDNLTPETVAPRHPVSRLLGTLC